MKTHSFLRMSLTAVTMVLLSHGDGAAHASPPAKAADAVQATTSEGQAKTKPIEPSLTVLPFTHKGAVAEADAGEILADLLLQEASPSDYSPVDGAQLITIESAPPEQARLSIQTTEQAINLGREAGVGYLVFGELSRLGVNHYLNARVVDCHTGEVTAHGHVEFVSFDQIHKPLRDLAVQLNLSQSDAPPPPDKPTAPAEQPTASQQIESLYLDGKLTQQQAQTGLGLLKTNAESLNEFDAMRLAYFMRVLDGILPTEKLQRALDLVAFSEQAHRESQRQSADAAQLASIEILLASAKSFEHQQDSEKALQAIEQLLTINPDHREAQILQAKITLADPPAKVGDTWTNSIGMTFAYIPPGRFLMGSHLNPDELKRKIEFDPETFIHDEFPQHQVTLTRPFCLAITEVTREQFELFINETGRRTSAESKGKSTIISTRGWAKKRSAYWREPNFEQGLDHPVVHISWHDAVAFCAWLSEREDRHYRVPTEAEWEYACRAGSTKSWSWGESRELGQQYANMADQSTNHWMESLGRSNNNLEGEWDDGFVFTSPVKSFKPNAWGLYDMHGNACEWTDNVFRKYTKQAQIDPTGPTLGDKRVVRGGTWCTTPWRCRSTRRHILVSDYSALHIGFRVALDLENSSR